MVETGESWEISNVTSTCNHCGDLIQHYPGNQRKYCSKACAAAARKRRVPPQPCQSCRMLFTPKYDAQRFCSQRCNATCGARQKRTSGRYPAKIEVRCEQCGTIKVLPPSQVKHQNGTQRKYCSRRCQGLARRGGMPGYQQSYYVANREKIMAKVVRWRKEHPEAVAELAARRRAQKTTTELEKIHLAAIYDRDRGICHLCCLPVARADATLDHVIPLSKGGSHTFENVKLAHAVCNSRKGAKLLRELDRSEAVCKRR